jgi:hypothetical protein
VNWLLYQSGETFWKVMERAEWIDAHQFWNLFKENLVATIEMVKNLSFNCWFFSFILSVSKISVICVVIFI